MSHTEPFRAVNERLFRLERVLADLRQDVTQLQSIAARKNEARLRELALQLAQHPDDTADETVERAEAYLKFLKGATQ